MTSNKDISTVYIDESGDLGINKGTQWFIISGAIISKEDENNCLTKEDENNCLKTFRSIQNQLNIKKIHLREIREFNKRAFVVKKTSLENFTFVNVVIDTRKLTMTDSSLTYNYACRLLLERCSWYLRDNAKKADIVLSSRGTSRDNELIRYIQQSLIDTDSPSINIASGVFNSVCAISAGQRTMLSLPDICATSLFEAYEKDRFGFTYPCFIKMLSDKMYKYKGDLKNYGIKYFSSDMEPNNSQIIGCNPCYQGK